MGYPATSFCARVAAASVIGLVVQGQLLRLQGAQSSPQPKAPVSSTLTHDDQRFDVVSIRPVKTANERYLLTSQPDGYRQEAMPLMATLVDAYVSPANWYNGWGVRSILGVPPWVMSELYDIQAKVPPDMIAAWQHQSPSRHLLQTMLRNMLADRCHLIVHRTTVSVPAFALVIDKHGPHLTPSSPGKRVLPSYSVPLASGGILVPFKPGQKPVVTFYGVSMDSFANHLSLGGMASRPVVNRTGLAGTYDFSFTRLDNDTPGNPPAPVDWDIKKLGLRLVPTTISIDAVQIDHIERPSPN